MYEARIIADSVCAGKRLTTMQLTHPRIIHAEFNTHCMFARNASSSRAIPLNTMLQRVMDDPFVPEKFGVNQKGMQASENLAGEEHTAAVKIWLEGRDEAVARAKRLGELNVHKQIANRFLEAWMWITVCVTGDWSAWSNYFALRCHPDADPSIQKQAYMAQLAYFQSTPKSLRPLTWHTPYVSEEEKQDWPWLSKGQDGYDWPTEVLVAVGRCARTSYLTQEGKRDFNEDVKLHDRLRYHVPLHASPFEHVCCAMGDDVRYGKYVGWKAYRHMLPGEYVTNFKPNHPGLTGGFYGD